MGTWYDIACLLALKYQVSQVYGTISCQYKEVCLHTPVVQLENMEDTFDHNK
jgi:hypothetical protein